MVKRLLQLAGMLALLAGVTACTQQVIPPCTPVVGATNDPCERLPETPLPSGYGLLDDSASPGGPGDVFPGDRPVLAAHIVVRATYLPDTIRCMADGVKRRAPSWYEPPAAFRNLSAMTCYADVRANEYLVGAGPATLTVQVVNEYYRFGQHATKGEALRAAWTTVLNKGGGSGHRVVPTGGLGGREVVLFLAAARDVSTQAWWVASEWDVQRRTDDTIIVVNPARNIWAIWPDFETHKSKLEVPLATFGTQVKAAHTTRITRDGGRIGTAADLPMLVGDVGHLGQYYTAVGAYAHADGPPTMPPAAPLSCNQPVPDADNNAALVADCGALVALWDAMTARGTLNWHAYTTLTAWDGVTVGGTPKRIQGLRLRDKGLAGTLPTALGDLTHLINLDLSENAFTGAAPTELEKLTRLKTLAFEYNQLTGNVPNGLTKLKQLTNLALNSNRLDGSIPTGLGSLSKLTSLDLAENRLTGRIPTELGNLSVLNYLSLGGNDLSGGIPTQLGGIGTLRVLYLDSNDLTGSIPVELGRVTGMEVLSLGGNKLTGSIPAVLGNMTNLEELSLKNNSLTGAIPAALGSLSNLEYLYLAGNKLTGCIPAGLRSVANNDLSTLRLSYCGA